jgi:hypothetical protein
MEYFTTCLLHVSSEFVPICTSEKYIFFVYILNIVIFLTLYGNISICILQFKVSFT